jgi:hypothetical protein
VGKPRSHALGSGDRSRTGLGPSMGCFAALRARSAPGPDDCFDQIVSRNVQAPDARLWRIRGARLSSVGDLLCESRGTSARPRRSSPWSYAPQCCVWSGENQEVALLHRPGVARATRFCRSACPRRCLVGATSRAVMTRPRATPQVDPRASAAGARPNRSTPLGRFPAEETRNPDSQSGLLRRARHSGARPNRSVHRRISAGKARRC